MCRSIKTLRSGAIAATPDEIEAAALQFVRKISGYRKPSPKNEEAFNAAVAEITRTSERLLESIVLTHPQAHHLHGDEHSHAGEPGHVHA
jgi:hypothetical protein